MPIIWKKNTDNYITEKGKIHRSVGLMWMKNMANIYNGLFYFLCMDKIPNRR